MSFNRVTVAALVAAIGIGTAIACGPNFPWQLLDDRDDTESSAVVLGFPFQASRLVAANDGLRAVEDIKSYREVNDYTQSNRDLNDPEAVLAEREEAKSGAWRGLADPALDADALLAKLAAARAAPDGEAALKAGAGLPLAVATYIAGAIEFRADRLDEALRFFKAIEQMPPAERRLRIVAALYMQGRTQERLGDLAKARDAFQAARRHAETGAPDPMGLGVASLGEEARIDLVEAVLVKPPWPATIPSPDGGTVGRLIANAVRLYAEQAARGSKMAVLSLHEVADRLTDSDRSRELGLAAADPLVRRLIVAFIIARNANELWDNDLGEEDLARVIDVVAKHPPPQAGDDRDRLAAFAYKGGRYDLAERLVADATRPLGLWVRAKLALRRGDKAAAARDWMAALAGAEQAAALDDKAKVDLRGETSVIKLSEGAYSEALQLLFPVASTFWGDTAYIAERVLTVDELKAFVDGLPPPPPVAADDQNNTGFWGGSFSPVAELRALLARRLVRVGRAAEAVAYFPASLPGPADQRDGNSATADDARNYQTLLDASRSDGTFEWPWQEVRRAEALFNLATMTRQQGMGLMGTEGPPDEQVLSGAFSSGVGQTSPNGYADKPSKLLGPDEAQRFAASAPKPDIRFHYRAIAADRAAAAADLLPQRSQAYAATLCWAAAYAIQSGNQDKADAIYRRYVANGAYQVWAKDFGQTCPDPDFEAARTFWWRRIEAWFAAKAGSLWRHIGLVLGVAVGIALLAGLVWRSRATASRHS